MLENRCFCNTLPIILKGYSPVLRLNIASAVSNYLLGGEIQARDFVPPAKIEENGPVNDYHFSEEQLQQVSEAEKIPEDNFAVQSNGSLQSTMNHAHDHLSATIEEPIAEPQKHTYASIVCIFLMFSFALNSKRMLDPIILKLFFFCLVTFESYRLLKHHLCKLYPCRPLTNLHLLHLSGKMYQIPLVSQLVCHLTLLIGLGQKGLKNIQLWKMKVSVAFCFVMKHT